MYVLIVVFDPEIINIQRNNCVTDSASGGNVGKIELDYTPCSPPANASTVEMFKIN